MNKINNIRDEFPILNRKINNEPLVYLDNAATSQIPISVQNVMREFEQTARSNVHRSVDTLGNIATAKYEESRNLVKELINAPSQNDIIFTSGATESLNMIAFTLGNKIIEKGDEIVITIMEHHSNIIPWQQLARKKQASLKYIELCDNGELDLADARTKITDKTKIVAVTHASNVLGVINPVGEISQIAHQHDAIMVVDGAQAVGHFPVDVQKLDADFYAFSGHKIFGPTGTGILYGKQKLLKKMPPYRFGGEMIAHVTRANATWAQIPQKFEAGTHNYTGVIGLGAAIEFLNQIGIKNIQVKEKELVKYVLPKIENIPGITVYGPKEWAKHTGVISINLAGIHPHDVATAFDELGVEVRAGHHCAEPLMTDLGITATVRASFDFYNTKADADALINAIKQTEDFFNEFR